MDDEAEIHRKEIPGKTYISPAVATAEGPLRIASKVIDSEGLHYAKVIWMSCLSTSCVQSGRVGIRW